ncbi:protein of unknown function [Limnospira indica PCC 8005]|uniref:Uncharacterized protein n=1 Tax=Limnospira indica PCC 8005 TaxID=376219 RepID=A0A9P1KI89_9CYAN|nr:protein of unknown function [Limnospira indica PCC 8005]
MKVGLWIHQGSPIPLKAHGRCSQSLFRTGFDFLRRTFSNLPLFSGRFHQALLYNFCPVLRMTPCDYIAHPTLPLP